jgi:hypothetical protein
MKKASTTVKKAASAAKGSTSAKTPAALEPQDWRPDVLTRVRTLIQQADPEVVEEVKWRKPSNGMRGVPVWSHGGILCTGETYKTAVKLTFMNGASLPDPAGLFNASLEGNTRRAIDLHEGAAIDEKAFKALIQAAVIFNTASQTPARSSKKPMSS